MKQIEILKEAVIKLNEEVEGSILDISFDKEEGVFELKNENGFLLKVKPSFLYKVYEQYDGDMSASINKVYSSLKEVFTKKKSIKEEISENIHRILPRLKLKEFFDGIHKANGVTDEIISFENIFSPILGTALVMDMEENYVYVTKNQIKDIGFTKQELGEIAIKNLRGYDEWKLETIILGGVNVNIPSFESELNAARLLTMDLKKMVDDSEGGIYISIPNESTFFIAQANELEMNMFAHLTVSVYSDSNAFELSPAIYFLKKDNKMEILLPVPNPNSPQGKN